MKDVQRKQIPSKIVIEFLVLFNINNLMAAMTIENTMTMHHKSWWNGNINVLQSIFCELSTKGM